MTALPYIWARFPALLPVCAAAPAHPFPLPIAAAYALLLLAAVNLLVRKPWLDWAYLALQSAIGLYLICTLVLPCGPAPDWQWLIVPFNPLPLIFWKWRKRWSLAFAMLVAVWEMALLSRLHLLANPAFAILGWAYVIFYLKQADRSHIFKERDRHE